MPGRKTFVACILMSLALVARGLFLSELYVPPVVDIRDKARMVCRFNLEGDHFYSLKWYKEESEFFRYMGENSPRILTFPVEGVHVLENESNASVITLSPLEYKSSGMYRCEVSAGAPHFKVVYRHANMSVLGLPKGNPKIVGLKEKYEVGSYVTANCTSSPSYPPAKMNWYINGVQAQQVFIDYYTPEKRKIEGELETRMIGLKFQTDKSHFRQTKDGSFSLVCSATVGDLTRSTEMRSYLSDATREKYIQGVGNGCPKFKQSFYINMSLGTFWLAIALVDCHPIAKRNYLKVRDKFDVLRHVTAIKMFFTVLPAYFLYAIGPHLTVRPN